MDGSDDRGGREPEEDHDLLTFNESGARLRTEIAEAKEQLAELANLPEGEDRSQLEAAVHHRLAQLELSQQRNSQQAAHHPGASGFLDYAGPGSTISE